MDKRDQQIVEILRVNARTSISDLAREVALSQTAVRHRIERLEKNEVIKGYTIVTAERMQSEITVIVLVRTQPKTFPAVANEIKLYPNVRTAWSMGGEYDMVLRVEAASLRAIETVTQSIMAIPGVVETRTLTSFKTLFDR